MNKKYIELSTREAKVFLKQCKHRVTKHKSWPLEVRYRGHWLSVCRTDLIDNVVTGGDGSIKSIPSAIRHCVYGARINYIERYFAAIDQATDG